MSKKSGILVILQIITMIYLIIMNNPFVKGIGLVLQIIGIGIGVWGIIAMHIGNFNIQPEVKSAYLVKSGPYRLIRNPMYLAVILFYSPILINNLNYINSLVFAVLLTTLLFKIDSEEQFLEARFGDDYVVYKKETKRLIPFIY